jgi:hypothetical protein
LTPAQFTAIHNLIDTATSAHRILAKLAEMIGSSTTTQDALSQAICEAVVLFPAQSTSATTEEPHAPAQHAQEKVPDCRH